MQQSSCYLKGRSDPCSHSSSGLPRSTYELSGPTGVEAVPTVSSLLRSLLAALG